MFPVPRPFVAKLEGEKTFLSCSSGDDVVKLKKQTRKNGRTATQLVTTSFIVNAIMVKMISHALLSSLMISSLLTS
jgi:hypothetical protein